MTIPTVAVEHLVKQFPRGRSAQQQAMGPLVAVDDVSLTVGRGEIFGLLGPNGAGKTTTIKLISTLLRPTSGTIKVAGVDVVRHPLRALRHLGTVLTGERSIYWKLTGRENLEYFAALHGLSSRDARRRSQALLERFALTPRADELVERYSTGMRQRICLAKALIAEPSVLILDEPTAGLDPQSARNLRELVSDIRSEGRTVILTTHYMEEADQLCNRVAIIDHGRIIALAPPSELKSRLEGGNFVEAELGGWEDSWGDDLLARGATQAQAIFDQGRRTWRITVHTNGAMPPGRAMAILAAKGAPVHRLTTKTPSLEDVFISLTGKSLRE